MIDELPWIENNGKVPKGKIVAVRLECETRKEGYRLKDRCHPNPKDWQWSINKDSNFHKISEYIIEKED